MPVTLRVSVAAVGQRNRLGAAGGTHAPGGEVEGCRG